MASMETWQGMPDKRPLDGSGAGAPGASEAVVDAGSTVYLRVAEPPRNVVFAWDTSPSVAPFVPIADTAVADSDGTLPDPGT